MLLLEGRARSERAEIAYRDRGKSLQPVGECFYFLLRNVLLANGDVNW